MNLQATPFSGPLLLSAVASLAIAFYVRSRRQSPGAGYLAVVMGGATLWSLAVLLQVSATEPGTKFFFTRVGFFGVLLVPTFWFAFALDYTGRSAWLRRHALWLLPMPLATLLVLWTNEVHGWFWRDQVHGVEAGIITLDVLPAAGFWVHAAYSYVLLLLGNALLLTALLRSATAHRAQFVAAIVACLLPWMANVLTVFFDVGPDYLDLTPMAFCITGAVLGWGFYRYNLLDMVPVAHDTIVERMSDRFLVLDARERIVDLNPAARALTDGGVVLGRPVLEVLPDLEPLLAKGRQRDETETVLSLRVDGHLRYFESQLVAIDDAGQRAGVLVHLHDITARLRAEEQLRELKDAADAANRAKTEFMRRMNHELRNPLTTVMGSTEMLQMGLLGGLTPEQQESVDAIARSAENMLDLVNETLDMARIEAGKVTLFAEEIDVGDLVRELAVSIRPLTLRKGNEVVVDIDAQAGSIHADRPKVRQCVLNLLTNAAKFTDQGRITLTAGPAPCGDGQGVAIAVRDTGTGIEADRLDSIFETFTQASNETARYHGGSGLGLGIARNYARLMGGDITVASRPGEGSTFTLVLPERMAVPPG